MLYVRGAANYIPAQIFQTTQLGVLVVINIGTQFPRTH